MTWRRVGTPTRATLMNQPANDTHADARADAIKRLNDALRIHGTGGRTMLTAGVIYLPDDQRVAALEAVSTFTAFDSRNDPYGEHDCAIVQVGAIQVMWKIDYYDLEMTSHSPDPANPDLTSRVLTIMLPEEY